MSGRPAAAPPRPVPEAELSLNQRLEALNSKKFKSDTEAYDEYASFLKSLKDDEKEVLRAREFATRRIESEERVIDAETEDYMYKNMRHMVGTSVQDVMKCLIAAHEEANTVDKWSKIGMNYAIAIITSLGISNNCYEAYNKLKEKSIFQKFDIDSREHSGIGKGAWIAKSKMNAVALRIAGHLIIEAGARADSSFAKLIRDNKGTIFSPTRGEKDYDKFCKEKGDTLDSAERNCPNILAEVAGEYIKGFLDMFEMSDSGGIIKTALAVRTHRN